MSLAQLRFGYGDSCSLGMLVIIALIMVYMHVITKM